MQSDRWARWSYERMLLLQPQVTVAGLWKRGDRYYVVCPDLGPALHTRDGRPLDTWFASACKVVTSPIELVSAVPEGSEPVTHRTVEELAIQKGAPRTMRDVYVELCLRLPVEFPRFEIYESPDARTLEIRLEQPLAPDQRASLESVYADLSIPLSLQISDGLPTIVAPFKRAPQGDIDIIVSRKLPPDIPREIKFAVEDDEQHWSDIRIALFSGAPRRRVENPIPKPWRRRQAACLIDLSVFPAQNLRNYLSLFEIVYIVAPLRSHMEGALANLVVSHSELVKLATLGRVRLLFPQSIDRYSSTFVNEVVENAPGSALFSRRMAAATILDVRERWPLFYLPIDNYQRHVLLQGLVRCLESLPSSPIKQWMSVTLEFLSKSWSTSEEQIARLGAMSTAQIGTPSFIAAQVEAIHGQDRTIEILSAGRSVEWAGAFKASLFPVSTDGYSEEAHAELVAALHSPIRDGGQVPVMSAQVHQVLERLLAVDGDCPIIPFATEFGSGDVDRVRTLVVDMASRNVDADFLDNAIQGFNREVRQYERKPDRLQSLSIASFVAALASAAIPDLEPAITVGATTTSAMIWMAQQNRAPEAAALGRILDAVNGLLAGVSSDAVLISRVRKNLAIMRH